MLNNKGFAITSVLYLLLVSFLMFLAITLSQFASSSAVIGRANDDLIENNNNLDANYVSNACSKGSNWYRSNVLIKIEAKQGYAYWPKNYNISINSEGKIEKSSKETEDDDSDTYKNIEVLCDGESCVNKNVKNDNIIITIKNIITGETKELENIKHLCN